VRPLIDSHLEQVHTFKIEGTDVNGPLNLRETVLSAQTSEPEWLNDQTSFTDVKVLNGSPLKYTLRQIGGVDHFIVEVRVLGSNISEDVVDRLRRHLNYVLGLEDDLRLFYRTFANDDPLKLTFSRLRGLRLMRGTDPFESLIFSILSQNSSAQKMNKTARLLMQHYGSKVMLPDGSTHFLFPTAEKLAKLTTRQLRAKTSIGYRAKPVLEVSRQVARNAIHLDQLALLPYEKAMQVLLELPGVGPKVADCFLLYGLSRLEAAPVDVWIHRIVSRLYFNGSKVSRLMTARFLRERFAKWAGYAQLYLFDYARHGMPLTNAGKKRANRT
jgi:N-glycosylase/DNA lyase